MKRRLSSGRAGGACTVAALVVTTASVACLVAKAEAVGRSHSRLSAAEAPPAAKPAPAPAASSGAGSPAATPGAAAGTAEIREIGDADPKLFLARHGRDWSLHAENLEAGLLLRYWHEGGGPEVISKAVLDFPFTLSLHATSAEKILERVLDGYGYTLHYRPDGALERVRVYSPEPTRQFKPPRLVETLKSWRAIEAGEEPAAPAASPQPGAAGAATAGDAGVSQPAAPTSAPPPTTEFQP